MSEECELEVDFETQEVLEDDDDIAGCLVETEFAAVEEEVTADEECEEEEGVDDELDDLEDDDDDEEAVEEEVVVGSDANGVQDFLEEELEDDVDDDEETTGDALTSMAADESEGSSGELVMDATDGKVGENEVFQWSAFTGLRVRVLRSLSPCFASTLAV
jgi:hypothetical protein